MIHDILLLVFLWAAIICSFIFGLFWNAHAYDRGYDDGLAERARRDLVRREVV